MRPSTSGTGSSFSSKPRSGLSQTAKVPRIIKHIILPKSPEYLPACPKWARRDILWTAKLDKAFELTSLHQGGNCSVELATLKGPGSSKAVISSKSVSVVIKSFSRQTLLARPSLQARPEMPDWKPNKILPVQVRNEWEIQSILEHSNIVPLLVGVESKTEVALVMERQRCDLYAALSDLAATETMDESSARAVLFDTVSALQYMHSQDVVHRDVKSENIFHALDGTWKLGDLGSAVDLGAGPPTQFEGTLQFAAPEYAALWGKRTAAQLTAATTSKIDIWGIGAVACDILLGAPPFWGDSESPTAEEQATCLAAVTSLEPWVPSPSLSPGAADFISRALHKDPALRATADELLQHPWLLV